MFYFSLLSLLFKQSKCQYENPATLKIPNEYVELFVLEYSEKDAYSDLLECKNNTIRGGTLERLNNALRINSDIKGIFWEIHLGIC